MIMIKYCSTEGIVKYFEKLHKQIHWLLVYREENFPLLDNYYEFLLFQLTGLQTFIKDESRIMELIVLIQAARIEAAKPDYNHALYRKAILDAHSMIDFIKEGVSPGE